VRTAPLPLPEVPGAPYSLWVLQEGFSTPRPDGTVRADGSITLVRGGPVTALVDTGGPWNRRRLPELLAERGLSPEDVTHVVCTHGHSDHVGNINLFAGATVVVGHDVCRGDGFYQPRAMAGGGPYVLDPGYLQVVATAGHTKDHVSLVVGGTALGTAVVAGDLFEKEEDEEEWRAWSQEPEEQEKSRRKVVAMADVIVPGHGPPFRVFREWGEGREGGDGAGGGAEEEEEGDATSQGG
ncbi:MBLC1 protein, partial [Bucorvus abyssinicus]|nr:MBLC1 protein [Bucorvus abyssinicus]